MADAVSGDGNGSLHNPPEESVIRSRSSTDASKAVTLAWSKKKSWSYSVSWFFGKRVIELQ